ncbi:MAG: asparaginase [Rikenellaceae bacterium]|nr:asparaginase [Rikenellaceae bacterium]
MKNSILILYTGGTIGMKTNPETGILSPFNFDQIDQEVPELKKFNLRINAATFDPPIDSANVTPELWVRIAQVIRENYDKYDGFVVLHGTDTMSYTASALSFMTLNLTKPVIFTGSQIPIGVLRTDGRENLITAVEIAAAKENGRAVVPEVCIYFQNNLFRANRTRKFNADYFNAFRSDNYPPLAEVGVDIHYNYAAIRHTDSFLPPFDIATALERSVAVIRIFPGMTPETFRSMLSIPHLRGVVLETYGSGNAPTDEWFIDCLDEAIRRGVVVINVTQCHAGRVAMERYETGIRLQQVGVVGGGEITTESAVTKLMCLLGQKLPPNQLKECLNGPIRGETTP